MNINYYFDNSNVIIKKAKPQECLKIRKLVVKGLMEKCKVIALWALLDIKVMVSYLVYTFNYNKMIRKFNQCHSG